MSSHIIELHCSTVKRFIKLLGRHGEVLTLEQMYARDNKECGKIAMGIVRKKYKLQEEGKRKLLKIELKEVYSNGKEGKLFPVFLFDSFAIELNKKLKLNDYVAFRSVFVENCTSYFRQTGHQELQALLGCPIKNGASILLMVYAKKNKQEESDVLPAKRRKIDAKSKNPKRDEIETNKKMYEYKKISEVTKPCAKINLYGVVTYAPKDVESSWKSIFIRIMDETCAKGFRVHVFRGSGHGRFGIKEGDIVRFHRMKIELYNGELDGRIFRLTDMVVFPSKGYGRKGAFSNAKKFTFTDYDKIRLAELRKWTKTKNLNYAELNIDLYGYMDEMEYNEHMYHVLHMEDVGADKKRNKIPVVQLSNITEAGRYKLGCKVVRVENVSDSILFLVVRNCYKRKSQEKRTGQKEVRICVVNPTEEIKSIPLETNVILHNVDVDVTVIPGEKEQKIFFYKMVDELGTYKEFRGHEDEAVLLTK